MGSPRRSRVAHGEAGRRSADALQLEIPLSALAPNLQPVEASLAALDHRQKELGAFYTPPAIASRLAEWAIRSELDRVLDPSFGNLAFLKAASERLLDLGGDAASVGSQLHGIDVDPGAIAAALRSPELMIPEANLIGRDFFEIEPAEASLVDVLLGNPPYIRYQGFSKSRELSQVRASDQGVRLSGLASSWAAFVVHGATFLRKGGRMAQVLPAELLHAQYAVGVLEFLERSFEQVTIAVFEERVFPGALEEVVLVLAEGFGADRRSPVRLSGSVNISDLDLRSSPEAPARNVGRSNLLSQLLPRDAQDAYSACVSQMNPLETLGSVDIGIVTGANEFFTLTEREARDIDPSLLRQSVSKAAHLKGASLAVEDHAQLLESGKPVLMLSASSASDASALQTISFRIAWGEERGFHERYKCRIRDPWWELPSPEPPDLLLTYCSSDHPRLAVNEARAIQTNTLHGVRLKDGIDGAAVAAAFYNSATLLSCELVGRSYGGGVLKLEPTEAERVLMPALDERLAAMLPEVDRLIRGRRFEEACDVVDPIVLSEGLGLSAGQIDALRSARRLLADRRQRRGTRPQI